MVKSSKVKDSAVEVSKPVEVPKPVETSDCPICMEPIGTTNCVTTECRHKFCLTCFVTHCSQNNKCPLCRTEIEGASETDWKTRYSNLADYARYMEAENDDLNQRITQVISENADLKRRVQQILGYLNQVYPVSN